MFNSGSESRVPQGDPTSKSLVVHATSLGFSGVKVIIYDDPYPSPGIWEDTYWHESCEYMKAGALKLLMKFNLEA